MAGGQQLRRAVEELSHLRLGMMPSIAGSPVLLPGPCTSTLSHFRLKMGMFRAGSSLPLRPRNALRAIIGFWILRASISATMSTATADG